MTRRFPGALQFLTILPVPGNTAPASEAAIFFPLVGALIGASAGAVLLTGNALLVIAWLLIVTGCIHEDGLADVADAFRAGRSRERILSILKDSRIGTYGCLALVMSVLIRWQALAQMRTNPVYAMIAALALSRTALVALAAIAPAAGDGLGREFVNGVSGNTALAVVAQAVAIAFLTGWQYATTMILSSAAIVFLARAYFVRRLGGVNGDCLGATCQIVETANLLILTWPRFS
jgi:adenosylcobinamide-GDP ribazoletransferase